MCGCGVLPVHRCVEKDSQSSVWPDAFLWGFLMEKRLIYKPVDCLAKENNSERPKETAPQSTPSIQISVPPESRDNRLFYVILSFVGLDFVLSLTKFLLETFHK